MKTIALIATLLVATPALAEITREDAEALSKQAFETLAPTGFSVAVVKDGKVIYADGFGKRALGKAGRVDADTMFQIASMTKSMTAAALAILVDEGKLGWDDKVIDYLPGFRLYDPYVTREFTIRDLLTHRSGLALGEGDLLHWPDAKSTRAEVIKGLRYLKPETSFRSTFAYDNLLYIVAGEVVGAVSGVPYEDFVEARLFRPLGMTRCRMGPSQTAKLSNVAKAHARAPGGAPEPVGFDPDEPSMAAGGAVCSANDLAKWAEFLLTKGLAADGTRILSEQRVADLFTPVTPMHTPGFLRRMGGSHMSGYALGWIVHDFEGGLIVEHGGAATGGGSQMVLLPEENVAVIALANDQVPITYAVPFALAERAANGEEDDWTGWAAGMMKRFADEAQSEKASAERTDAPPASLPLSAYAGTYHDPWYGDVYIRETKDGLYIDMPRSVLLKGPLVHHARDVFIARWPSRAINADAYVTFDLDENDAVIGMRMKAVSETTDFSYDYQHLSLERVSEKK